MTYAKRARRSSVAGSLLRALAVAAVVVPLGAVAQPAVAASSETLLSDAMQRSVGSGWGAADTGGAYAIVPAKAGSVNGSAATLSSPGTGRTARALLSGTAVKNATSEIEMTFTKRPGAGSVAYASHLVRATGESGYAARLVVNPDGKTSVQVARSAGLTFTTLASVRAPITIDAGKPVIVKVDVSGDDAVTVQAKVWTKGEAEPGEWQVSAKDDSDKRVRAGGSAGVLLYAQGAGAVVPVNFDNLKTTPSVAAPAKPAPSKPAPSKPEPSKPAPSKPEPSKPATPPSDPTKPAASINYPGKRGDVGAAAPGTKDYPVPAGAIIVATNGKDTNPGTVAAPVKTITRAVEVARDGGTVAIRGGNYHEEVFVMPRIGVKIQPYRKEAVWLDGAESVTGWKKSGSVWVKSGWTKFFDSSPTYAKGKPDGTQPGWQWVNPEKPMASHPDQIWLDGKALTQVGSRAQVKAGTFFVDKAGKQLVMGSDPTGKKTEASTLAKGMTIRAKNSTIQGIGVRRYATSVPMMGTVSADLGGVTIANVTIRDNATTGFYTWASNVTLRDVTTINNGLLGAGGSGADGLKVSGMLSAGNNAQGFNRAPVSGSLKITRSRNVSVTHSSFVNNQGQGPWFDESVYNLTFTDNDVVGNSGYGMVVEISEKAIIANNLITGNGMAGLAMANSGNVAVWNNTLNANAGGIRVTQDTRRASNTSLPGHDPRQPKPDPTVPWIVKNVSIQNNVVGVAAGADCVLCVNDWSKEFTGATMISKSDGNLYHRPAASSPKVFAKWSAGKAGNPAHASFKEYVAASGRDKTSNAVDGSAVLTGQMQVSGSHASTSAVKSQAVPANVAAISGLTTGAKVLGAQSR